MVDLPADTTAGELAALLAAGQIVCLRAFRTRLEMAETEQAAFGWESCGVSRYTIRRRATTASRGSALAWI